MKSLKLILIFTSVFAYSQSNIFDRLSVLDNNGKTWYNIDGYSVTSEVFNNSFVAYTSGYTWLTTFSVDLFFYLYRNYV